MCVKLNDVIKSGIISKDKIFYMYKYVNDICSLYYDSRHQYDSEVIDFFNILLLKKFRSPKVVKIENLFRILYIFL